jgi:hypothetical protein
LSALAAILAFFASADVCAADQPLDEVTVSAQHIPLTRRVQEFVTQIAPAENGGEAGLARWKIPAVCPLVSGLLPQEGESILERVSEIARAANVPLAGEHCRPNLYVLVTAQPEGLLRAMERRNFFFTFGEEASPSVVDEFIRTPRPVRVWYNSGMMTPEGRRVPPHGYVQVTSLLQFGVVWSMSRVFVIVDQQRLQGVSRRQFADYIAMVALAHIKPGARLSDAPTILRLFDEAPQAAPTGLSDWDQAFLRSLYSTDSESKLQRGQITRSMVREIAP